MFGDELGQLRSYLLWSHRRTRNPPKTHTELSNKVSKGNKDEGTNGVAPPEQNNTNGHSELTLRDGICFMAA